MAEINKETIKNLTKLSRINCTEGEQEALLKDLGSILSYFEQLEEIDTKNVTPCNHVLENVVNVTREDIVGETMSRENFLSNAPKHFGGMIAVPPIFKQS